MKEKSGSASFIFGPRTLRPARPNEKRKDARTGFAAKARGAAEAGRLHQRIHRQAHEAGRFDLDVHELWKAFCAVKSGQWSKKTRENLQCLFGKHVVPIIGKPTTREVTLTSLQLLLNKMAEDGYRKSAVGHVRTYLKACFEYATDEDLIQKSPARKLAMPNIQKKSCERFLSIDEFRALLSHASPREHLVLRILAVCGLRPAEILVLRMEDFEGTNSESTRL